MDQVIAKEKTNTELAMWLEGLSSGDRVYHTDYPNFHVAAQRLLNTTKPDCIFTLSDNNPPAPLKMLSEAKVAAIYNEADAILSEFYPELIKAFCVENGLTLDEKP